MSNSIEHCIICNGKSEHWITTKAQMHRANMEQYHFNKCEDCQLVFLSNRVTQEQLHDYYTEYYLPYRGDAAWGKYAPMVANSQRKVDTKRAQLVNKHVQLENQKTVLDIGCGKPSFLDQCHSLYQAECIGIDFSDHGWSTNKYDHLDLTVTDIHTMRSLNESPDAISMWHYLEHDYDPKKTLNKLRSISDSDTKLFIEVPNFDSLSEKKYKDNWAGYHTPRHTYLFSPDNISQLLNDSGWKVQSIDIKGTLDPYNLYWMSEMELKNIDWTKNMESEFWSYVRGMLWFNIQNIFRSNPSHGIMTIVASVS